MTNTITLTATSNVLQLSVTNVGRSFDCQLAVGVFVDITRGFSAPSLVQKYMTADGWQREVMTPLTEIAAGERIEFLNMEPCWVTRVDRRKGELEIKFGDNVSSCELADRHISLRYVREVACN